MRRNLCPFRILAAGTDETVKPSVYLRLTAAPMNLSARRAGPFAFSGVCVHREARCIVWNGFTLHLSLLFASPRALSSCWPTYTYY